MKDFYGVYKGSRDASWRALLDFHIRALPVSVIDISKQAGILIVKNSDCGELSNNELGVTLLSEDKRYIVYDNTVSKYMARYTIAHELGHIFLGHALKNRCLAREVESPDSEQEWQATRFAIDLLAPACVLWGLGLHTAEEIQERCEISYSSAKIRAERMKILYARNKFLTHPLEQKVFENFSDYIRGN